MGAMPTRYWPVSSLRGTVYATRPELDALCGDIFKNAKMTAYGHPNLSPTLRVIAGACAALWLVGSSLCGAERISGFLDHDQVCVGHASPVHEHGSATAHEHEHEQTHDAAQAHHHDDGEAQHEHSSNSKKGCDERLCCSTMQVLLHTAKPVIIANSIPHQVFLICPLNSADEHALAPSNCEPVRQARTRNWVFTPAVCLGPAHRSLAPPSPAVG